MSKRFKIREEKAVFVDIKSAVSIALFDINDDVNMDDDVRKAVMYNSVVFEDLMKRLFSYQASREDRKDKAKEKSLIKMIQKDIKTDNKRDRVYYIENPNEDTFNFLDDVLSKDKKVRGYSEYILYSLFNNYFDYIKN